MSFEEYMEEQMGVKLTCVYGRPIQGLEIMRKIYNDLQYKVEHLSNRGNQLLEENTFLLEEIKRNNTGM